MQEALHMMVRPSCAADHAQELAAMLSRLL
jgi:hypothetical protein